MIPRDEMEAMSQMLQVVVGILAAVALIWKKGVWLVEHLVLPPYRHYRAVMQGFAEVGLLRERMEMQELSLGRIEAQLTPNGGTSALDAINRMEREQRRSTARMDAWFNTSSGALFECDAEGECTFVNEAYLRLVGREREEVFGSNWLICVDQDLRKEVCEAWEEAVSEGRIFEMAYAYRQPSGYRVPVLVRADPVRDQKGAVICWLGHVQRQ